MIILPERLERTVPGVIEKHVHGDNLAIATTSGLETAGAKSTYNEDRVGYRVTDNAIRICVADGHWGDGAADRIVRFWLDEDRSFPESRQEAVTTTKMLADELHESYGTLAYEKASGVELSRTPEAAFIVAEIGAMGLRVASYGDCRLMVVRDGDPVYVNPQTSTWLGALSVAGLRGRLSVEAALVYQRVPLLENDIVLAHTDGVDECVYETLTISASQLAARTRAALPTAIIDSIMNDVMRYGAEDHASLAVVRVVV